MKLVKKRGSILVFVLGLVVLLGTLCLRLMEETVQELRHVSQFHKRDDLRLHAYSLLDITVGVLNEFRTLDNKSLKSGGGWGPFGLERIITPRRKGALVGHPRRRIR